MNLWYIPLSMYKYNVSPPLSLSPSSSLFLLGWEWKPEDRPSFATISVRMNSVCDVNESKLVINPRPWVEEYYN